MEQIEVVKESKIGRLKDSKIQRIIYFVSFYFLAAVLLFSGIAKILDPVPLINTLKLVTFIPVSLHILIATLLPVIEIGFAFLMISKTKLKITQPIVTFLFTIFLGFSIYGTAAGFGADCGCFGTAVKSSFGFRMIIRNAVFLIISLILTINAWPGRLNNK